MLEILPQLEVASTDEAQRVIWRTAIAEVQTGGMDIPPEDCLPPDDTEHDEDLQSV